MWLRWDCITLYRAEQMINLPTPKPGHRLNIFPDTRHDGTIRLVCFLSMTVTRKNKAHLSNCLGNGKRLWSFYRRNGSRALFAFPLWPFSPGHQAGRDDSRLIVTECNVGRDGNWKGLATYRPVNSKCEVPHLVLSREWIFHLPINFQTSLLPHFITHRGVPRGPMKWALIIVLAITQLS